MFIVKRQTKRLKLRRSDMYLTFIEWQFKNKTTNMFLIGLNLATVMNKIIIAINFRGRPKERVMPLLRSFDCLVDVQL